MRIKGWFLIIVFILAILMQSVISPLETDKMIEVNHMIFLSQAESDLDLTWTSRWQTSPQMVVNDTELVGDHVVLNATFPHSLNVTRCTMTISNGFRFHTTRKLVIPSNPGSQFDGIINHTEFDWIIVKGIERGMTVNIVANFTNDDTDFMAWSGEQTYSEFAYSNNLVDMASGDKPETDTLVWDYDNDTMYLGCLNYAGSPGNWTLYLQVGVYKVIYVESNSLIYDSYTLDRNNQTIDIEVVGRTVSDENLIYGYRNVSLSNFFTPSVVVYKPIIIANEVYNITWTCTDKNANDTNFFSVGLSGDDGVSFQVLARNLTQSYYIWDAAGFMQRDDYIYRVRAFSVDLTIGLASIADEALYWPGDFSDTSSGSFTAGFGWIYDPIANVLLTPLEDATFYLGAKVELTWKLSFDSVFSPYSIKYDLLLDGSILMSDATADLYPNFELTVSLGELAIGTYNLTLIIQNPGWHRGIVSDTVVVTVRYPPPELLRLSLLTGISIGSLCVIGLVVVLIIRDYRMLGKR